MALRIATQRPRPKVDLIFAIKRDFAVIKEPFPAHVWTLAASKSYRRGADRQSPGTVAGPGGGRVWAGVGGESWRGVYTQYATLL